MVWSIHKTKAQILNPGSGEPPILYTLVGVSQIAYSTYTLNH